MSRFLDHWVRTGEVTGTAQPTDDDVDGGLSPPYRPTYGDDSSEATGPAHIRTRGTRPGTEVQSFMAAGRGGDPTLTTIGDFLRSTDPEEATQFRQLVQNYLALEREDREAVALDALTRGTARSNARTGSPKAKKPRRLKPVPPAPTTAHDHILGDD